MTTGTLLTQAVYPSLTVTPPAAKSCARVARPLIANETERSCAPAITVKFAGLVAVPDGVVRVTLPVVAPPGTVALTCVALTNAKVADTPLNLTDVTPVKLDP